MYDAARYEPDAGIVTITIDHPDVLDAFRERTISKLNDALRAADKDDGVYVLVLSGADRGFCTDADVTEMPEWHGEMTKKKYAGYIEDIQNVVRQLRAMEQPSIAADCDFALACELRVVGPDAHLREGSSASA